MTPFHVAPEAGDFSGSPVSIIVPNFNGALLLRRNLPSLLAALEAYPGRSELIVVDDGSTDASCKVLAGEFPQVTVIRHRANRGFAEAVHSGIKAARFEFLVLLNSDVQPERDFLVPLITRLHEDSVFSVSPLILEETGRLHPCSLNCFSAGKGRLKRLKDAWTQPPTEGPARPSLFASGGSMAVKKSLFLELGGFLPVFRPFYWEDFDLGIRAWRKGWRILMEPASRVVHQQHGSIRANVARHEVRVAVQRNKLLVEWLHVPPAKLLLGFLPRLVLRMVARTLIGDPVFWPALIGACARLPQVVSARKEIAGDSASNRSLSEVLAGIRQENIRLARNTGLR